MTSRVVFAQMYAKDFGLKYKQTRGLKEMNLKLVNFAVLDAADQAGQTGGSAHYKTIVESIGETVFDADILMFDDIDADAKERSLEAVDLKVKASVGRVRVVFLMKFVNDFLSFLDPFINNQNIQNAVADTAANAQAAAIESLSSIYR